MPDRQDQISSLVQYGIRVSIGRTGEDEAENDWFKGYHHQGHEIGTENNYME
jgi:hypothetical protein